MTTNLKKGLKNAKFQRTLRKMFDQVREENKLTVLKMKILPVCQWPSSAKSALEINTCKCSWNLMGNICVMVTDSLEFLIALGARIHTQRGQKVQHGVGGVPKLPKNWKISLQNCPKKSLLKATAAVSELTAEEFPQQTKSSAEQQKSSRRGGFYSQNEWNWQKYCSKFLRN